MNILSENFLEKQAKNNNILMGAIVVFFSVIALLINSFLGRLPSSIASSLLIQIGLFIFAFGSDAIVVGNLYSTLKKDTFWSNEEIKSESEHYIFRTPDEGFLFLHFKMGSHFTKTRFRADIWEYIPYSLRNAQTKCVFNTYITESGTHKVNLNEGEYNFRLQNSEGHRQTGFKFTLEYTRIVKPLAKIYAVGLTLLEIGIPLFISGVILLVNSIK